MRATHSLVKLILAPSVYPGLERPPPVCTHKKRGRASSRKSAPLLWRLASPRIRFACRRPISHLFYYLDRPGLNIENVVFPAV